MFRPDDTIDWHSLWADLLQGVGAGLLQHDGSRLAQAALMGLDAFDAAQERRGRWKRREPDTGPEHREQYTNPLPWPDMSAAEIAAFQRLSPEERTAFEAEMAEVGPEGDPPADAYHSPARDGGQVPQDPEAFFGSAPRPVRRPPASANPFEDRSLEAILPFGRDGRLNIPIFRR